MKNIIWIQVWMLVIYKYFGCHSINGLISLTYNDLYNWFRSVITNYTWCNPISIAGWWLSHPSGKYGFVTRDEIPN